MKKTPKCPIYIDRGCQNEERKSLMDEIDREMDAHGKFSELSGMGKRETANDIHHIDNLLLREKKLWKLPKPGKKEHRNFLDYM